MILQSESAKAMAKLDQATVAYQSSRYGYLRSEPLLIGMDGLLRYAKAYEKRWGDKLATDGFLGEPWLNAAKGLRALLNGDGAVAMESGTTTDSKDNGVIEEIFWAALAVAGFTGDDL